MPMIFLNLILFNYCYLKFYSPHGLIWTQGLHCCPASYLTTLLFSHHFPLFCPLPLYPFLTYCSFSQSYYSTSRARKEIN